MALSRVCQDGSGLIVRHRLEVAYCARRLLEALMEFIPNRRQTTTEPAERLEKWLFNGGFKDNSDAMVPASYRCNDRACRDYAIRLL